MWGERQRDGWSGKEGVKGEETEEIGGWMCRWVEGNKTERRGRKQDTTS